MEPNWIDRSDIYQRPSGSPPVTSLSLSNASSRAPSLSIGVTSTQAALKVPAAALGHSSERDVPRLSRPREEIAGAVWELPPRVSSTQEPAKNQPDLLARLAESSRSQLVERLKKVKEKEANSEIWSAERCMLEVQNCVSLQWEEMAKHGEQIDKQTTAALENMKSEYSAALAEIRKDLGVHHSIQAELSEIRNSLNMKMDMTKSLEPQPQLSEALTAVSEMRSDLQDCRMEQQSKFATLHEYFERQGGAISYSDSAISDLRNEIQLLRNEWQQDHVSQDEAHGASLQEMRRQLIEMQRETSHALQEMEKRHFSDVTSKLEDLQQPRDSIGTNALELSQSIDKLRNEMNLDRSQSDLRISGKLQEVDLKIGSKLQEADLKMGKCEAFITDLQQQLEDNQRHLDQMQQVGVALSQQRDDHSSRIDSLKRLIEQDQLKRNQEAAMLGARLDGMERSTSSAVSAATMPPVDMSQISVRLDALESSYRSVALSASSQNQEGRDNNLKSEALATILERLEILELKSMSAGSTGSYATNEIASLTARLQNLEAECRKTVQAAVEQVLATLTGDSSSSFGARLLKLEKELGNAGKGGHADPETLSEREHIGSSRNNAMASEVIRLVADVSSRIGVMEHSVNEITGQRLINLERVINLEGEVKKLSLVVAALMERNSKVLSGGLVANSEDLMVSSTTSTKDQASESSASHKGDCIDVPSSDVDLCFDNLKRLVSQVNHRSRSPGSPLKERTSSVDKCSLRTLQPEPKISKVPVGDPSGAVPRRLCATQVETEARTDEILPFGLKESLHDLVNAVQRTLSVPESVKATEPTTRSFSPLTRERGPVNSEAHGQEGSLSARISLNVRAASPVLSKAASPNLKMSGGGMPMTMSETSVSMSADPPRARDGIQQQASNMQARPSSLNPYPAAPNIQPMRSPKSHSVTVPIGMTRPGNSPPQAAAARNLGSSASPAPKQMAKAVMPQPRSVSASQRSPPSYRRGPT